GHAAGLEVIPRLTARETGLVDEEHVGGVEARELRDSADRRAVVDGAPHRIRVEHVEVVVQMDVPDSRSGAGGREPVEEPLDTRIADVVVPAQDQREGAGGSDGTRKRGD